ncbi:hypothetical protein RRG08_058877 [Elysia crispata]|uniref:Uncharacterized protein n=1 Tax=Elysia crispata TaxID=231223 RepID=A0AAE1CPX6_9GAST|nr:hypothetical protein RRG08_058877 [Elysia crispata]
MRRALRVLSPKSSIENTAVSKRCEALRCSGLHKGFGFISTHPLALAVDALSRHAAGDSVLAQTRRRVVEEDLHASGPRERPVQRQTLTLVQMVNLRVRNGDGRFHPSEPVAVFQTLHHLTTSRTFTSFEMMMAARGVRALLLIVGRELATPAGTGHRVRSTAQVSGNYGKWLNTGSGQVRGQKSDAIDPARDKESQDASLPHHFLFAIIRMTLQLVHDDATNLSIQTTDSLIQNKTLFDTGHSFLVTSQRRADTLANN